MSEDNSNNSAFYITKSNGEQHKVACPICGGEEFGSARPPQEDGKGFYHVITGREKDIETKESGDLLSIPVNFRFCLGCGYVVKFMIPRGKDGS